MAARSINDRNRRWLVSVAANSGILGAVLYYFRRGYSIRNLAAVGVFSTVVINLVLAWGWRLGRKRRRAATGERPG